MVSYVRSCLTYGGETWLVKVQYEVEIDSIEMSMIRWMVSRVEERKKGAQCSILFVLE